MAFSPFVSTSTRLFHDGYRSNTDVTTFISTKRRKEYAGPDKERRTKVPSERHAGLLLSEFDCSIFKPPSDYGDRSDSEKRLIRPRNDFEFLAGVCAVCSTPTRPDLLEAQYMT